MQSRALTSASFSYEDYGKVTMSATADTGNSYKATIIAPAVAWPISFDNAEHCDHPDIICWSGVSFDDDHGTVCVHVSRSFCALI